MASETIDAARLAPSYTQVQYKLVRPALFCLSEEEGGGARHGNGTVQNCPPTILYCGSQVSFPDYLGTSYNLALLSKMK